MRVKIRRLKAEEQDFSEEIKLCIRCREIIESEFNEAWSWRFEHSQVGPFTTIWLCHNCQTAMNGKCVGCHKKVDSNKNLSVCEDCLSDYKSNIYFLVGSACCRRCEESIPRGEWEIYLESDLCARCHQMLLEEGTFNSEEDRWFILKNLQVEFKRIFTPEQFRSGFLTNIDTRLIAHLDSHPEDLYSLTPWQFQELIAELLKKFGYQKVRLGKRGKDGGVDIYAERESETGFDLSIVQCKRHKADHKVGEPIIKQLFTDVQTRNATRGLIVTTSTFTRDALKFIESLKYRLTPVDIAKVKEWLGKTRLLI